MTRVWPLLVTLAVAAPACLHDWDALAGDGGAGGAGGEGGAPPSNVTVDSACLQLCNVKEACVSSDPACLDDCAMRATDCSQAELEGLIDCRFAVQNACSEADVATTYDTCVGALGCWL